MLGNPDKSVLSGMINLMHHRGPDGSGGPEGPEGPEGPRSPWSPEGSGGVWPKMAKNRFRKNARNRFPGLPRASGTSGGL